MFRVYNMTDKNMTDIVWRTADEAIQSCQYLTDFHQKDYVVFAAIYSSKDHQNNRLAKRMADENDKYGCD
jgi:hypothetical protein